MFLKRGYLLPFPSFCSLQPQPELEERTSREFLIKTGGCLKKGRLGTHSAFGPLFEQHTVCTAKDNGKDSRAERGGRRARSPSTGKGKGMWASQKSVGTIGSVYV